MAELMASEENLIILMRHAQSGSARGRHSDFDRTLNDEGRTQATAAGKSLRDANLLPTAVVCSAAVRTTQTLQLMQAQWSEHVAATFEKPLYLAGPESITASILAFWHPGILLVLGHNPGLEHLASELSGVEHSLSPAAIVVLQWTAAERPQHTTDLKRENFRLLDKSNIIN